MSLSDGRTGDVVEALFQLRNTIRIPVAIPTARICRIQTVLSLSEIKHAFERLARESSGPYSGISNDDNLSRLQIEVGFAKTDPIFGCRAD